MNKIFLPFAITVFFLTLGCSGDSNQSNHPDMTGVPDENNPIIQAKKQKEETKDTVVVEIENTQQEIEESSEKMDEAINKL
jgi:hypothetical protein